MSSRSDHSREKVREIQGASLSYAPCTCSQNISLIQHKTPQNLKTKQEEALTRLKQLDHLFFDPEDRKEEVSSVVAHVSPDSPQESVYSTFPFGPVGRRQETQPVILSYSANQVSTQSSNEEHLRFGRVAAYLEVGGGPPATNIYRDLNLSRRSDLQVLTLRRIHKLGANVEAALREHFGSFGEVETIVILPNKTCRPRKKSSSLAFIAFSTEEAAASALAYQEVHLIRGSGILVKPFSRPDPVSNADQQLEYY